MGLVRSGQALLGKPFVYPRRVGWIAVVSGAAFMYNGVGEVAYEGFVPSTIKLVGLALLAVGAFVIAVLMWRNGSRRRPPRVSYSQAADRMSSRAAFWLA